MGKDSYDWAQICPNGHVVTSGAGEFPQFRRDFCEDCGAKTLEACPSCETRIPGAYGFYSMNYTAPAFCGNCGKPYPWTQSRLNAAKTLADEIDELDVNDRALFKTSLDDISANTPMTEVAVLRIKKVLRKTPGQLGEALKRVTIEVATEAAKKLLLG